MEWDYEVDIEYKYRYSSSLIYRQHPYYKQILDLGKPIVPYLFYDLRKNRSYPACLLSDILPDVSKKLGEIYGNKSYPHDFNITKSLWLRWWDDSGSKLDWTR